MAEPPGFKQDANRIYAGLGIPTSKDVDDG